MQRLTAFRLFFLLAALLFVAKPFFGFSANIDRTRHSQGYTILAKSFTKRKPESIEEADVNIEFIHQSLIHPLLNILSTISILLLTLFPAAFKNVSKITGRFLSGIRYALLPPEPIYLLSGKLII
ncbi:MAG: hypothetical protein JWP78_3714 [Mucilaginibacter sp.]|nr:hypothetical protein [Mucilaginibacter sp.]